MAEGYVFALLTGIFYGLQGAYSKGLSEKLAPSLLVWSTFTFALPYLAILLIVEGIPPVQWKIVLLAIFTSMVINILAWNLFFRALSLSSLAHTMPFTSFTPIFIIPLAYVLYGEVPSFAGFIGILMIIIGSYGIHLDSSDLFKPWKSLYQDRGTRYMLIVALIWSISATVEKAAVVNSSPLFTGFMLHAFMSLAYIPALFFQKNKIPAIFKTYAKSMIILGLIAGLVIIFQFMSLKTLFVSYVIAFKRSGVLISVLLGIFFLKEAQPLKNLFFTAIMVGGVFLILL
jgi:drug/metabolite transporter (DMT)-like permease